MAGKEEEKSLAQRIENLEKKQKAERYENCIRKATENEKKNRPYRALLCYRQAYKLSNDEALLKSIGQLRVEVASKWKSYGKWGLAIGGSVIAIVIIFIIAFEVSKNTGAEPESPTMPDFVGMNVDEATALASNNGLTLNSTTTSSVKYSDGQVVSQNPAAGQEIADGTAIEVVVNRLVVVPNVVSMNGKKAKSVLQESGLAYNENEINTGYLIEEIVKQNPAAGAKVVKGATINVEINYTGE